MMRTLMNAAEASTAKHACDRARAKMLVLVSSCIPSTNAAYRYFLSAVTSLIQKQ